MDTDTVPIGLLEGKSNWSTWTYKLCILLLEIVGAIDILEGKIRIPLPVSANASADEKLKYETELAYFTKADSTTPLVLTTNMTEKTLKIVMRFANARDVKLELHRLYDGNAKDKTFCLCMQFFSYKIQPATEIAAYTSKLKNLWNALQVEIVKDKLASDSQSKWYLPAFSLIYKIL